MIIAAITGTRTEKELAAIFSAKDIDWRIARSIEEADPAWKADLLIDFDFVHEESRCQLLSRFLPAPVMINAVVPTLHHIGHPFIRINAWAGFLERPIHEAVALHHEEADKVMALYQQLGHQIRFVTDTPGMISARILASIINEAWYAWEQDVSTQEHIDTAMLLGTNYPIGPFEWGNRIGLEKVTDLLTVLSRKNHRYIPAASLKKAATGTHRD